MAGAIVGTWDKIDNEFCSYGAFVLAREIENSQVIQYYGK